MLGEAILLAPPPRPPRLPAMPCATTPSFRVDHAALSDIGMRRANNQDAVAASVGAASDTSGQGALFMVADGMGAHAAGELASQLAVENVPHTFRKLHDEPVQAALRHAMQRAGRLIYDKGQSSPELNGMGTTCTCMVALGDAVLVAHVGDSRVYRLRDGKLEQLTFDHSLVWELAAASHTTEDKLSGCFPKNVITRSLGPHRMVNVDLEGPFDLRAGDAYLLCSDGLTTVVEDELIGAVLGAMPPSDAAHTLVDVANLRGGPDNISVIAVSVGESNEAAASEAPPEHGGPKNKLCVANWAAGALAVGCAAAIVWCILTERMWGAVAAALGLGIAASRALAVVDRGTRSAGHALLGGPYGNGPYREFECGPGPRTTDALRVMVEDLSQLRAREGDENGAAKVDWGPFDEQRRGAEQAAKDGDHPQVVRCYSCAVRRLMEQVRGVPSLEQRAIGGIAPDNVLR